LLLDEVWLRTRRTLVTALEEFDLWPAAGEHQAFFASQRTRGERLRDEVLLGLLSEDDRRWLASPSMFGASNRRFRARTPITLSFGCTLSEGLQSLDGHPPDGAIAETCGIFNFGISIFDLLHDAQPRLVSGFASRFDRNVLLKLHSDSASPHSLRDSSRACEEPEIRLLLQTIAGVYERLYGLAADLPNGAFTNVTSLLSAAYAAEMQSSACASATAPERLAISRAKSTLPFAIIAAIGALRREHDADRTAHETLVNDIGTIFWLTDDLVDVVGDARSGALNSLLVRAAGEAPLDVGSNLVRLIEGRTIVETVTAIRDALVRVRSVVGETDSQGTLCFDRLLASYVRTWIE
jgi:hypothetical protein